MRSLCRYSGLGRLWGLRRLLLPPLPSLLLLLCACSRPQAPSAALVFQSDFGLKDAAVASMKGVAFGVSPALRMYDLTHEIPAFNVWEAAQRLAQTAPYWPPGTVFVTVVDPGVGTARKSVVLKTRSGHYFVSPDNGTLTVVAKELGIAAVREIDESVNRLPGSERSATFHGRDVYAFTGARLAAGIISFEQVGRELPARVASIPYQEASYENGHISGNIPILDPQYGNVWTNIGRELFERLELSPGAIVRVRIREGAEVKLELRMPVRATFGDVAVGEPLLYLNSLGRVAFALREGNFAAAYGIGSGPEWSVRIWSAREGEEKGSAAGGTPSTEATARPRRDASGR